MWEIIIRYISVFLMGLLGIWKAVPLGFVLNIHPLGIFLMTSSGAIIAVFILYFFGGKIRNYILKKRERGGKRQKENRATRLFEKYGAAGLGFLGCLLMGPNMTIILGLVIVKSQKKFLFWTVAGIIVWTLLLTLIALLSMELFYKILNFFQ
jgi:membrane protein DedA with SNARE-associated domain